MAIFAPPLRRSLQEFQAAETRVIGDGDRVRVSGTGIGLGIWQTWSPTYTNLTVGNGTVVARYVQIGKFVTARFEFILGSTSSIGTDPDISLPVTASSSGYGVINNLIGGAVLHESGVARHIGAVSLLSTTTLIPLKVSASDNTLGGLSATLPFTWGTNDVLGFTATYEAA